MAAMFRAASYNVLATAYIRPRLYPRCEPAVLDPAWRVPAVARHVAVLDADLIGLQEVDAPIYAALEATLAPLGYAGHYARKVGRKPDGCATFYRQATFGPHKVEPFAYADGSGHVALLVSLEHSGGIIGLANTHLKWAPPGEVYDLMQAQELLAALAARRDVAWIVCGDFNAKPDSAVIAACAAAGYRASHVAIQPGFTCNPNGAAKTIDYLCHTATLRSSPRPLPPIGDLTPLPSREQPSDHLAVVADFTWAKEPVAPAAV
jgi:mRNA deadenylase 3'-5' endonuclease subunit Ccr4